jgi:hypothetical protein
MVRMALKGRKCLFSKEAWYLRENETATYSKADVSLGEPRVEEYLGEIVLVKFRVWKRLKKNTA